jgi:hypothetical protein
VKTKTEQDIPELAFALIEASAALEDAGLADPTKYERQNTVDRAKKYMRAGWESWPDALREAEQQAAMRNGPRDPPFGGPDPQLKLPLNGPTPRAA